MSRNYWYFYNGSGSDILPGNYNFLSTSLNCSNSCSAGGHTACAILVPAGGPNPTPNAITVNIQAYLAIAKANGYKCYPLTTTPYVGARV